MARNRSRPRSPFVVTVALAAASAACSGSTSVDSGSDAGGKGGTATGGSGGAGTGGWGNEGGCGANPPAIPCPDSAPEVGSACPVPTSCHGIWWGSQCSFPDTCGGTTQVQYDCSQGTWKLVDGDPCATCPPTKPKLYSACSFPSEKVCTYPEGCCALDYSCVAGKWESEFGACPPPATICPGAPPNPGDACDPCTTAGECSWDQCATLGQITKGSCANGVWAVSSAPCWADGGAP